MPQFGTWLLANIFTALLPPLDPEEADFYDILGVPRDATSEQIRKAYKVQSLKLHPDKIAQRRGNAQEAQQQYERVQEAYGVLQNDTKRQRYHALQCSPRRYRFVNQGSLANPGALYENLTHASMFDKTRLVVLCTLIIGVVFIQPILVATKINHLVDGGGALESSKWTVLLIPTWAMGALWILFHLVLLALAPMDAKVSVFGSLVEYMLWFVGLVLLALKWDNAVTSSYAQVLTPLYLAKVVRWIFQGLLLLQIRNDVGRMVTVEHLEKVVLKGKSLEELTEEERETLKRTYLVVTVPDDFEPLPVEAPEGEEIDMDEIIELQKVEASHEYEAAMDMYFTTLGSLIGSLIFGVTFFILLTLKLDRKIDVNYWIVFVPVWIHYGSRWVYYCYQCACGTVAGDEIILQMQQQRQGEESKEGDEEAQQGGGQAGPDPTSPTDRPKDQNFVDPAASFSKFNASSTSNSKEELAKASSSLSSSKEEGPNEEGGDKDNTPPPVDTTKEEAATTESVPTADDTKESNESKKEPTSGTNDDEDKDETAEDHIHIDEETFHAWQNAYEEAERGAMEQQAKASMECCNLGVQLMVIIMVVAKIEDCYWDNDDPNDPGFNTFWILFPFFLFFGLVLCCCACLIYGAEPGKASDLQASDVGENETAQLNRPDVSTLVIQPPTEEEANKPAATELLAPPSSSEPETKKADVEEGVQPSEEIPAAGPNIDDLD